MLHTGPYRLGARGLDRLAAHLGIWALRRLYGADCDTDVRDDWPDRYDLSCVSCDAKRMIEELREVLK